MPEQQALELRTWGGKRRGAGRPSRRDGDALPHGARERVGRSQPVHVTLRMADYVWNLRSERSYAVIHVALEAARRRPDARVVHFSIQGNHVHLILEADGTRALANTVRALSIRLARGLNRMMGRSGPVFADRYHAHVLRTPAEVRNALRYVVGNFASHAARRGEPTRGGFVDPFSSAVVKVPREAQGVLFAEPVTCAAETWLLRRAEHGARVETGVTHGGG
jgi:REP element-mobilizing transposase RayT